MKQNLKTHHCLDRTARWKQKEILWLTALITQMDITYITEHCIQTQRNTPHSNALYGDLFQIEYILKNKASLNRYMNIETTPHFYFMTTGKNWIAVKTETTESLQTNAELLATEWKMCQERNWRISRSEWEWVHTIPNIMKCNENNSKLRV